MIWVQFAATALVIVLAGVRLLDTATSLAKRGGVEAGSTISATGSSARPHERACSRGFCGSGVRLEESATPGTAHTQRRVAGVSTQNLHEVGRVREAGASPYLRCRHTIEEW